MFTFYAFPYIQYIQSNDAYYTYIMKFDAPPVYSLMLAYFMSSLSVDTPWLYSYCISFISCLCQVSCLEPLRVLYCNNTSRVYFGL